MATVLKRCSILKHRLNTDDVIIFPKQRVIPTLKDNVCQSKESYTNFFYICQGVTQFKNRDPPVFFRIFVA